MVSEEKTGNMYAKKMASCSLYIYLKVLLLRWPQVRLSPEVRQQCVFLPESFTAALMQTGVFFFGVSAPVFYS